jgi:hypothetical protein
MFRRMMREQHEWRKTSEPRRSNAHWLRWMPLALAAVVLGSASAQASLITDFAGNTQPVFTNAAGSPVGVAGFINFAVFDRTGGTSGDSFNTGVTNADTILSTAGFHPNDAFLYLFQVTNHLTNPLTSGPAPPISTTTVSVVRSNVDGFGSLVGIGAAFNGTPLNGGDPGTTFGPPAAAGNQSPAVIGVSGASASFGTVVTTATVTLPTPTSLLADFVPAGSILAGGRSDIFGYTSNFAPALTTGSLQDDGTSAVGTVPSNVIPEPSSIVMIATAVPVGAVLLLRRRAKGGATPPSA